MISDVSAVSVMYHGRKVGMMSVAGRGTCQFEYDKDWLANGFSISPLKLPLKAGLFTADFFPFEGNFGIFEDSLPGGYGQYLLLKVLRKSGIDYASLTPVQRLSIIGSSGMGALCYYPENNVLRDDSPMTLDEMQQMALHVLSEKTDENADVLYIKSGNSGGVRPKAVYRDDEGHWLVKFRHIYDPKDIGQQEYHYNKVARNCGIDVPDFKLMNGRYFATRRFDIAANEQRVHTATAGGLLGISLTNPILDYGNLLALTGYMTQSAREVEEMYRRMVFNYLTDNKDDHCKNFSYYVQDDGNGRYSWHLAPAYDLTLCTEGYNGEHATSVNGTGNPSLSDMIAVGVKIKMNEQRCLEIFEEVESACGDLLLHRIK